jgi:hypothetical protein
MGSTDLKFYYEGGGCLFDIIGTGELSPATRSESFIRGIDCDEIGFLFFIERML